MGPVSTKNVDKGFFSLGALVILQLYMTYLSSLNKVVSELVRLRNFRCQYSEKNN